MPREDHIKPVYCLSQGAILRQAQMRQHHDQIAALGAKARGMSPGFRDPVGEAQPGGE